MEAGSRIEIEDKEGWRKEISLDKRLIYVGSDSRNDIVLSALRGSGVAARHMQLIHVSGGRRAMNVVNLSAAGIPLGEDGGRLLEPNSAMEVSDGERFTLGDFKLTVHLSGNPLPIFSQSTVAPQAAASLPTAASGASIGLRVSLPQPLLGAEAPIEGIVYLSNQGIKPGVQFRLWIEGLPEGCWQMGPAPILFPGAEKGLVFRLTHPRLPGFVPGAHRLVFKATAEESYPEQCAVAALEIRLLPYYSHTLRILAVAR